VSIAAPPGLFSPPDTDAAHAEWKANCGPCAFAALLGRNVNDCRKFFPRFPAQPWTNPTHMRAALDAAGATNRSNASFDRESVAQFRGLVFVQLDGPWCAEGVPIAAAYRNTHWAASSGTGWMYDANVREWIPLAEWRDQLTPWLVSQTRRATGWWIRTGIEVKEQR
jgi:hypothetical protein